MKTRRADPDLSEPGGTEPLSENSPPGATLEQKLQRLEAVVGEMETGELTLEALLARYREGQQLLAACQAELDRAEMIVRTYGETPPPASRPSAPQEEPPKDRSGEN